MTRRAVLFDVGGAIDLEFAWEIAVDGAIASACGMEGIRVDQQTIEQASERAVAAFAVDVHHHMIETLCGGEPVTMARVRQRVEAMTGKLDAFQLRPEIEALLQRLRERGLKLGVVDPRWDRLEHAGIAHLFERDFEVPPQACIFVGDRLDRDIAPAKATAWRRSASRPAGIGGRRRAPGRRRRMPTSPTCASWKPPSWP